MPIRKALLGLALIVCALGETATVAEARIQPVAAVAQPLCGFTACYYWYPLYPYYVPPYLGPGVYSGYYGVYGGYRNGWWLHKNKWWPHSLAVTNYGPWR